MNCLSCVCDHTHLLYYVLQDALRTLVLCSVQSFVDMVEAAAISTLHLHVDTFHWTDPINISEFKYVSSRLCLCCENIIPALNDKVCYIIYNVFPSLFLFFISFSILFLHPPPLSILSHTSCFYTINHQLPQLFSFSCLILNIHTYIYIYMYIYI